MIISFLISITSSVVASERFFFDNETSRILHLSNKLDEKIENISLIYKNDEANHYLQQIMDKLFPEYANLFRVRILLSTDVNAFALANGSIYFTLGLLAKIDNEAQVAAVLAHEGAHCVLSHQLNQRRKTKDILTNFENFDADKSLTYLSEYSIDSEYKADELGLKKLAIAGYNPTGVISMLQILAQEELDDSNNEIESFQTHPETQKRIDKLTTLINDKTGEHNKASYQKYLAIFRTKVFELYLSKYKFQSVLLSIEGMKESSDHTYKTWFYIGEAYRQRDDLGDNKKAESAYLNALKINPLYTFSYQALGILYLKRGELNKALNMFDQYLSLKSGKNINPYIMLYHSEIKTKLAQQ